MDPCKKGAGIGSRLQAMQTLRQEAKLAQVAVETTKTHWAVELN